MEENRIRNMLWIKVDEGQSGLYYDPILKRGKYFSTSANLEICKMIINILSRSISLNEVLYNKIPPHCPYLRTIRDIFHQIIRGKTDVCI